MREQKLSPHARAGLGAPTEPRPEGASAACADKLGRPPDVRRKENAAQAAVCGLFALLGAFVGLLGGSGLAGLLTGLLCGLIAGLLLSGGALLVIGLFRR